MKLGLFAATVAFGTFALAGSAAASSLRGSPASMRHQHEVAKEQEYTFLRTGEQVREYAAEGRLDTVAGNADYRVNKVSFPYARPEVVSFIERLAREFRAETGEQLVVTSLTRPTALQPRNAHRLSVHPAGIAIDLRIPSTPAHRGWLELRLLVLENAGVLDVTREKRPPHYHVAVFPERYLEWAVANPLPLDARVAASVVAHLDEVSTPPIAAALPPAAVQAADIGGGFGEWAFAALAGLVLAGTAMARRRTAVRARRATRR